MKVGACRVTGGGGGEREGGGGGNWGVKSFSIPRSNLRLI